MEAKKVKIDSFNKEKNSNSNITNSNNNGNNLKNGSKHDKIDNSTNHGEKLTVNDLFSLGNQKSDTNSLDNRNKNDETFKVSTSKMKISNMKTFFENDRVSLNSNNSKDITKTSDFNDSNPVDNYMRINKNINNSPYDNTCKNVNNGDIKNIDIYDPNSVKTKAKFLDSLMVRENNEEKTGERREDKVEYGELTLNSPLSESKRVNAHISMTSTNLHEETPLSPFALITAKKFISSKNNNIYNNIISPSLTNSLRIDYSPSINMGCGNNINNSNNSNIINGNISIKGNTSNIFQEVSGVIVDGYVLIGEDNNIISNNKSDNFGNSVRSKTPSVMPNSSEMPFTPIGTSVSSNSANAGLFTFIPCNNNDNNCFNNIKSDSLSTHHIISPNGLMISDNHFAGCNGHVYDNISLPSFLENSISNINVNNNNKSNTIINNSNFKHNNFNYSITGFSDDSNFSQSSKLHSSTNSQNPQQLLQQQMLPLHQLQHQPQQLFQHSLSQPFPSERQLQQMPQSFTVPNDSILSVNTNASSDTSLSNSFLSRNVSSNALPNTVTNSSESVDSLRPSLQEPSHPKVGGNFINPPSFVPVLSTTFSPASYLISSTLSPPSLQNLTQQCTSIGANLTPSTTAIAATTLTRVSSTGNTVTDGSTLVTQQSQPQEQQPSLFHDENYLSTKMVATGDNALLTVLNADKNDQNNNNSKSGININDDKEKSDKNMTSNRNAVLFPQLQQPLYNNNNYISALKFLIDRESALMSGAMLSSLVEDLLLLSKNKDNSNQPKESNIYSICLNTIAPLLLSRYEEYSKKGIPQNILSKYDSNDGNKSASAINSDSFNNLFSNNLCSTYTDKNEASTNSAFLNDCIGNINTKDVSFFPSFYPIPITTGSYDYNKNYYSNNYLCTNANKTNESLQVTDINRSNNSLNDTKTSNVSEGISYTHNNNITDSLLMHPSVSSPEPGFSSLPQQNIYAASYPQQQNLYDSLPYSQIQYATVPYPQAQQGLYPTATYHQPQQTMTEETSFENFSQQQLLSSGNNNAIKNGPIFNGNNNISNNKKSSSKANKKANKNNNNSSGSINKYNNNNEEHLCSIHGAVRMLKHLRINANNGKYECIPGFHCLELHIPDDKSNGNNKDNDKKDSKN